MMPMICGVREAMAVSVRLAGFAHSLPWNTQVEISTSVKIRDIREQKITTLSEAFTEANPKTGR